MDTASLNEQIDTAVAIEAKEGHLANYLADLAAERDVPFDDAVRRDALEVFESYVRSVPELLASASAAAAGTPVEAIMGKIMEAAVTYWEEPDDLVPDELGLLGLLDDAYFSLQMLQAVSTRLRDTSGQPLILDDLSALDAVVRDILGEHLAEILDDLVILSLSNAPVDQLVATIAEYSGSFILQSAQTSFTGLSVVDIVEEKLSFTAKPGDSLREDLCAALQEFASRLGDGVEGRAIGEGRVTLEQVFRAALGEAANSDDSDIDLAVSLLVGAVVQQALCGHNPDEDFVARCVHFVVDGVA